VQVYTQKEVEGEIKAEAVTNAKHITMGAHSAYISIQKTEEKVEGMYVMRRK